VYSGAKVELREVVLRNKPEQLIQISPKATVPVLELIDGEILEESLDIIYWAMSLNDNEGWFDLSSHQKEIAESLIAENDSEFKSWLDKYKYSQRFPEESELYYRKQGESFLVKLNDRLKQNDYLISNKLSYVDIAIAPFIRQFANVDRNWLNSSTYQLLVKWLDNILNSSIFIMAMQKYPPWEVANDKVIFP
jgi:glutathione S-transferase